MLHTGTGTSKDDEGAARYWEKSAKLGNINAQYALGTLWLETGSGDSGQAVEWLTKAAKAEPHKLAEKIQSMLDEIKALTAENEKLKDQIAKSEVADVMDQVVEAGDYKVLPVSVKDVDMNALRTLGDDLKDKIGSGVIILASDMGGKVNLIVTATDDAVKSGAHAGKIIK